MKLTDSQFARVGRLVLTETGVLLRPQNRKFIEKRLARLAKSSGIQTIYQIEASLLSAKNTPLKIEIIECVLDFETEFFSGKESFRFLRQHVLPKTMASRESERTLRFWSAGCSTGQEPFSLSIMLEEYLFDKSGWKVEILATDLSVRCLKKAAKGFYKAHEVEDTVPKNLLEKHFEKVDDGWVIAKRHLERVVFRQHNLLHSWSSIGQFDVVLMRNVLTYVLSPYKRKVAMHTYEQLEDTGHFFLGKGETPGVGHFFVSISDVDESCYRKSLDVGQGARLKKLATTQREMSPFIFSELLKLLSVSEMFSGLNRKSLESIAERFEIHKIRSGQKVIKQGGVNQDFFIVFEGEAKVSLERGVFKKDLEISTLSVGDVFGITSLVTGQRSTASVVAHGTLRVFVGSQALFDALADRHEVFRDYVIKLREKNAKRSAKIEKSNGGPIDVTMEDMVAPLIIPEELQHLMMSPELRSLLLERGGRELTIGPKEAERFKEALRKVPLFADMELNEIDDYVALSEYWTFPVGARVIHSGDQGSGLYMVTSGSADIMKQGRKVDTISRGQVFGENSIVNLMPEAVDVVAAEELHVFIVGVELFRYVVGGEVDEDLSETLGMMSGRLKEND